MRQIHKLAIGVWALLLAFALYACTFSPSADEVVAHIQQSLENEQAIHLTQESSYITEGGETYVSFVERWNDGVGRSRLEIRDADGELITLSVQNGSKVQFYDAADNSYSDSELYLSKDGLTNDALGLFVQNIQSNFEFTMREVKELAGRRVFHLQAVPTGSEISDENIALIELWIDTEHYTLLGSKITEVGGYTMQEIPLQVEYNPELPNDLFTFSPPEGATPK